MISDRKMLELERREKRLIDAHSQCRNYRRCVSLERRIAEVQWAVFVGTMLREKHGLPAMPQPTEATNDE